MRIIFVRHGHPNYEKDCLSELGHRHAEAAAHRLKDEGVERIYSSTCGRAFETAQHLGELIGLPVAGCDFMREISWGDVDGKPYESGHPWTIADEMVARGEPLVNPDWRAHPEFCRNRLLACCDKVAAGADAWLAELGYIREGAYYRVQPGAPKTIAAFGHGGETAAVLTHLFNLPFPFACQAMGPDYTGITIVEFPDRPGDLVAPRFELMNDARHIRGMTVSNFYGA